MNERRLILLLALALITVVLAINISLIGGGFLWDDYQLVSFNSRIRSLKNTPNFFTKGFWENTQRNGKRGGYYRPLILLSYAVDYQLYRLRPWGYHLTNVLVHIFVVLLSFFLFLKLEKSTLLAFASSLIFGVSPIVKEPVGWVAGRTDLFAAFFAISSLLALVSYLQKKSLWKLVIFYLLFIFSLLSKESAYILPLLVLLILLYMNKFKEGLVPWLIMDFIWGTFLSIALFISLKPGSFYPPRAYNFPSYSLKALGYYFSRIIFPYDLPPVPDYPTIFSSLPLLILGGIFLLLLLTFPFKPTRKFGFYMSASFICLIPALAPIILSSPTPIANRFAYLSSIFLYPAIFLFFKALTNERLSFILLLLLAVPIGKNSMRMNNLYTNEGMFWTKTYRLSPNSVVVGLDYGIYLVSIEKYEKGLQILDRVLERGNLPLSVYILLYNSEAAAYIKLGKEKKGERILKDLLRYPLIISRDSYEELHTFYFLRGNLKALEELSKMAIRREKDNPAFYSDLARAQALQGKFKEAEETLKKIKKHGGKRGDIKNAEGLIEYMQRLKKRAEKDRYAEALFLYMGGDLKKSEEKINRLLQEEPDNNFYMFLLFRIKMKEGEKEEASNILKYLEDNSRDYKLLGEIFRSLWYTFEEKRMAAKVLEYSLRRFPDQPKKKLKYLLLENIREELNGGENGT